jgi:hypothetical protein
MWHKSYTNTHNFYSIKYYKHFIKQYYRSSLCIKNSSTEYQKCVFKYFLKATLNFDIIIIIFIHFHKLHRRSNTMGYRNWHEYNTTNVVMYKAVNKI